MTEQRLRPAVAWVDDHIEIIDQTALPESLRVVELRTTDAIVDAIKRLSVRGAPAIGACGAFAMVVGLDERAPGDLDAARAALEELADVIGNARPTAVNLSWAVNRVRDVGLAAPELAAVRSAVLSEAHAIVDEDRDACRRIGAAGRAELAGRTRILTHCNTGRLATTGWGTALGVIYAKTEAGEQVRVYSSETRPLFQGARLTTWELLDAGIDVTLLADGGAAAAMANGLIEAVIVGADRIAANGDTANKIGTYSHAVNAAHAGIPFYVAAPLSTFDPSIAGGEEIEIELRDDDELRRWADLPIAPPDVATWNPAFDITPHALITGIITEVGVLRPPYTTSIAEAFDSGMRQHREEVVT